MQIDKRFLRRAAAPVVLGLGFVIGAVAFVGDAGGFQKLSCRAPGVRSACAWAGWGGVSSAEQEAAWKKAAARPDGDGLRAYLRRWPRGAYAIEAQARLARCQAREVERWKPEVKRLPLHIGLGPDPKPTEEAARAEALERANRDSQDLCVAYTSGEFRLTAVTPEPERWNCQAGGQGQACGFEGKVACNVEVRHVELREICPPGAPP